MTEHFVEDGTFETKNAITVKKYKSKQSSISVYFCDMDSQVINGYFAFGIDQPEACGIESLLFQLDSSGGLLPRPMRSDMLKPAWQFHGAENPLADRDQSCYVCCALGETAFLGTFACCVYLLQNIEAVFELHGFSSADQRALEQEQEVKATKIEGGDAVDAAVDENANAKKEMESLPEPDGGSGDNNEPKINCQEFYCLSESGEGAMAWEATLQAMFPGTSVFWNRLLFEGKNKINNKMRDSFDQFYRPENLTVVISGTVEDREHILETLHEYEVDHAKLHPKLPEFVRPWVSQPLPPFQVGTETNVRFMPRNYTRIPTATICLGWRGCPSTDIQTSFALKVLTAYMSVGPLWNKYIIPGLAQRISWCLLEYSDMCSLVTIHGVKNFEDIDLVVNSANDLLKEMATGDALQLTDVHGMAERVNWHNVREMESEPSLILASLITKAELYGNGENEQLQKRLESGPIFEELMKQPLTYWKELITKYFLQFGTFVTKIIPRSFDNSDAEDVQPGPSTQMEEKFELSSEHSFVETSKRASSRPRRKSNNPVAEEGCSVVSEQEIENPASTSTKELEKSMGSLSTEECPETNENGYLEKFICCDPKPFPFHIPCKEAEDFGTRLRQTTLFLDQIICTNLRNCRVESYFPNSEKQHPKFSLDKLPFCTVLENLNCSFVYLTLVMDTTHLSEEERSQIAIITSAIGAILCPRPPGLDTDFEIETPTEFNPPMHISDSQVSLGLNGEMVQNVFITLIIRPEHYKWAVGMIHHLLYGYEFTPRFLKFICQESAKGLAYNYRMQTVEVANYEYFDASEINMYSLIKQIYKEDSNARLFVGRRRLDLVNTYLKSLDESAEATSGFTQSVWRHIVDNGNVVVQIATNVDYLVEKCENPVEPWTHYFGNVPKRSLKFSENCPKPEELFIKPLTGENGVVVKVKHTRPSCLTLAIPVDPHADDFPALCIAMQMFSIAQKWIWMCLDEDDNSGQPILRMPCSFPNIITLNLESPDVIGEMCIMKEIMNENWDWLASLLIVSKLMLVNEPAGGNEVSSPQNTIAMVLLTKLSNQPIETRRDLMMRCLQVTMDDVKAVIVSKLSKLFDPKCCWYSLMVTEGSEESSRLISRLQTEFGFNFIEENLTEICTSL